MCQANHVVEFYDVIPGPESIIVSAEVDGVALHAYLGTEQWADALEMSTSALRASLWEDPMPDKVRDSLANSCAAIFHALVGDGS